MKTAQLIGFDEFDADVIDSVREKVQHLWNKYKRIFGAKSVEEFKLIADTIRKKRDQYMYEVVGSIKTTIGSFHSTKKKGWNILEVVDEVVEDLGRQIVKKKEIIKSKRKLPDNP